MRRRSGEPDPSYRLQRAAPWQTSRSQLLLSQRHRAGAMQQDGCGLLVGQRRFGPCDIRLPKSADGCEESDLLDQPSTIFEATGGGRIRIILDHFDFGTRAVLEPKLVGYHGVAGGLGLHGRAARDPDILMREIEDPVILQGY